MSMSPKHAGMFENIGEVAPETLAAEIGGVLSPSEITARPVPGGSWDLQYEGRPIGRLYGGLQIRTVLGIQLGDGYLPDQPEASLEVPVTSENSTARVTTGEYLLRTVGEPFDAIGNSRSGWLELADAHSDADPRRLVAGPTYWLADASGDGPRLEAYGRDYLQARPGATNVLRALGYTADAFAPVDQIVQLSEVTDDMDRGLLQGAFRAAVQIRSGFHDMLKLQLDPRR